MARYDGTFVDRFLEPWNRHDVDGALALMTDDCVLEIARGRPHDTQFIGCRTHPVDDAVGFANSASAMTCHLLARAVVDRARARPLSNLVSLAVTQRRVRFSACTTEGDGRPTRRGSRGRES
jgi:hypothetical protein